MTSVAPARVGVRHFGGAVRWDATAGLAVVTLILLVVRLCLAGTTGLVDDEAYYRLWSLGPALSYYDHPPAVAWFIAAGRAVAGDTALGVRLFASLAMALGVFGVWRTAFLIGSRQRGYGDNAAWFFLAMPLLAVGGVIMTPDVPSVLSFGAIILLLAELERSQDARWWLAVGIAAGFGLLSKYTNLFAGVTILIWLLALPANRKWFGTPELWIGGAITAIMAAPVIAWNAQHHWASFIKQFGRVGDGHDIGLKYLGELAGGYIGLASPVIAALSIFGLVVITKRAVRHRQSGDVLIAAAILPQLAYFLVHAVHGRVQANWLAPLYPPLAICAAAGLETIAARKTRNLVRNVALALGFASTVVVYLHAVTPLITLRKDPTGQMRGWTTFAASIDAMRRTAGATWLVTSSYATTGQLSVAFRGNPPVAQLDDAIRYENLPTLPASVTSAPGLYVDLQRRANVALVHACFADVKFLADISRHDGVASALTYSVYRVANATGRCPVGGIWRAESN